MKLLVLRPKRGKSGFELKIGKNHYGNYVECYISDGGYGYDNNTVTFDVKEIDELIKKLKELKEDN